MVLFQRPSFISQTQAVSLTSELSVDALSHFLERTRGLGGPPRMEESGGGWPTDLGSLRPGRARLQMTYLRHFGPAVHLVGMGVMAQATPQDVQGDIASAAAGDQAAFGRIVADHHEDMRRICAFVTRDEVIADDAVQAAWAIVWQKLGSLREPERLRPWLMRVAINEAKHLARRGRRRGEIEVRTSASGEPGGIDPATGIDAMDLQAAIARLDPDDRALLALRYGAGFNAAELSAALGISPSGTRTRLERLVKRLRRDLGHG